MEVPCTVFNVTLDRLLPLTEYLLTINPFPLEVEATSGRNRNHLSSEYGSNSIRFISPQVEFNRFSKVKSTSLIVKKSHDELNGEGQVVVVKFGELFVVLFVLFGWFFIIFLFIKKWGKIRGIETTPVASVPLAVATTASIIPLSNPQSLRGQRSKESDEDYSLSALIAMNQNPLFKLKSFDLNPTRRTSCCQFGPTLTVTRPEQNRRYQSADNLRQF